ncbi:hypothetical protein SGGMMB4_02534 [Sodalis glossinidius str. 'morsitans']|uniref:Uncharacterized protein n=1 Tax=Sodalis glossinidius (strain morsitans) TaxID=343509 RepID=A0A193QIN8_SODGM|nr:hypothetical protein SGGMMB4_02534 [Sodalis glossinidius str. 'morsitans']
MIKSHVNNSAQSPSEWDQFKTVNPPIDKPAPHYGKKNHCRLIILQLGRQAVKRLIKVM